MPMTKELWAEVPPEERRRRIALASRAAAVKTIVEQWPELTEVQQQKLRALLRPVPEGGES
jgi:ribosomal 50S subunit-associated protein YjgA (DUF615 family)